MHYLRHFTIADLWAPHIANSMETKANSCGLSSYSLSAVILYHSIGALRPTISAAVAITSLAAAAVT
jgi:hypothetical protein